MSLSPRWQLAWVLLAAMAGCATPGARREHGAFRDLPSQPGMGWDAQGSGSAGVDAPSGDLLARLREKQDAFQLLQESAGLREDARHATGEELESDDARDLWEELARTPVTLRSFGPRRTLAFLLRLALTDREDVPYGELLRRTQLFRSLAVMRPDGYLVGALDGRSLQRMGRLELRDGRLMAGSFEVGAFYRDRGGTFYTVDEALQPVPGGSRGELGLDHDWFNAALDGAGDALEEMVVGMATLVIHPIRSAEGLAQLPSAVATLISASPDYFARYSALPLQEQIREAARLSTHLLTLYGSAAGTVTRLGSVGARLPVLSLTAEGALALEQVSVPTGAAATALGTGAGAVYVLMAAEGTPKDGGKPKASSGPGEWKRKKFAGSERARKYQEQITRHSADEVYFIGEVEYDGFEAGVFQEAKAEGYLEFFEENMEPKYWYENSGRFRALINQAAAQSKAANGILIQWHVAERGMVEILQYHFAQARISGIQVIFTPPVP